MRYRTWLFTAAMTGCLVSFLLGVFWTGEGASSQSVPVRVDRWLLLKQISGQVMFNQGGRSRPARQGDRLQTVGDGITTGEGGAATLEVDTGVGFVNVAEKTEVRVQSLAVAPDNGRITRLFVPKGQVRLQLRRFTHRGSELEVRTPAGISGVRGTEFGLTVQPNGKTGIATRTGRVETTAQGQRVAVAAGFQNLMVPGDVPSPPVPLRDDTRLYYQIERRTTNDVRRQRLVGQVDPVNTVYVEGLPIDIDRNGRFVVDLPLASRLRIRVTVVTPLGKKQVHEVAVI
ncbi:FecR family protein [Trichothermofontia sp.]